MISANRLQSGDLAGTDSRQSACENGFSHQRTAALPPDGRRQPPHVAAGPRTGRLQPTPKPKRQNIRVALAIPVFCYALNGVTFDSCVEYIAATLRETKSILSIPNCIVVQERDCFMIRPVNAPDEGGLPVCLKMLAIAGPPVVLPALRGA